MGVRRFRNGGKDKPQGDKEAMKMKQGLFEGGADLTALQRLRRPVVVRHAAWRFSFSSEEEAAELGHLMRKGDTQRKRKRGNNR